MAVYYCRELWHNQEGESWFRTVEISSSDIHSDQLLIESLFSMISCGTERMIFSHPPKDQAARHMQVPYMLGSFEDDFTYGYSSVGKVIVGPSEWMNRIVHVMHPHQDYMVVNQADVFPVPDFIRPEIATLASNLETVINAIWDSGITLGDRVLIIGFGIIGALLSLVIKHIPGIDLSIFEIDPERNKQCEDLGFFVSSVEDSLKKDYNVAFNTSANESGIQTAIEKVGLEGKVVELSWYGPHKVSLNLGGEFHYGRKIIISSQVSHIPVSKRNLYDFRARKHLVFKILSEITFDGVISKKIPYGNAPEFYKQLIQGNIRDIGVLFNYK